MLLAVSLALGMLFAAPPEEEPLELPAINADGSRIAWFHAPNLDQTSEYGPSFLRVHDTATSRVVASADIMRRSDGSGEAAERLADGRRERALRALRRAGFRSMRPSPFVEVAVDDEPVGKRTKRGYALASRLTLRVREGDEPAWRTLRSWTIPMPAPKIRVGPSGTQSCEAQVAEARLDWDAKTGWSVLRASFLPSGGHWCAFDDARWIVRVPALRRPGAEWARD